MLIAPSILSANFGQLQNEVKAICDANCDYIHIDVMDGHFVPNLTIGPIVIEAIAKISTKPLDIHLMVQNNSFFVDILAPFKPAFISFHIEEEKHPHRLIQKIKDYGISPAIVLNPHTAPESIEFLLEDLDMILIMSVNPGFGGQKFLPNAIQKIIRLRELIKKTNSECLIEIDGGINDQNVQIIKNAGADIVVAGNFIFKHPSLDYKKAIESLRS